jgi:hypothetical protein
MNERIETARALLAKRHPDLVRAKRMADDDGARVDVLCRAVGQVPLASFELDDAERAMASLDELRQAHGGGGRALGRTQGAQAAGRRPLVAQAVRPGAAPRARARRLPGEAARGQPAAEGLPAEAERVHGVQPRLEQ